MSVQNQPSLEGVETDFGFVPYSEATKAYLDRHAPLRNEPKRRSKAWKHSQHQAERVAFAVNVCAGIAYVSGKPFESF